MVIQEGYWEKAGEIVVEGAITIGTAGGATVANTTVLVSAATVRTQKSGIITTEEQALDAAREALSKFDNLPKTGKVAAMVLKDGTIVIGYSRRAAAANGINRNTSEDVAADFNRGCGGASYAEAHVISKVGSGNPSGGFIAVVEAGRKSGTAIRTCAIPCETCGPAITKERVRW